MARREALRREAVFGAADGLTAALGLIVSLAGQRYAMWHAALGVGIAGLVGMTAGKWLSDEEAGFAVALANGSAAMAACIVPALPALGDTGAFAVGAEVALVTAAAGLISWLRPEKGILAAVQTYGVLLAAAVLCLAAGRI